MNAPKSWPGKGTAQSCQCRSRKQKWIEGSGEHKHIEVPEEHAADHDERLLRPPLREASQEEWGNRQNQAKDTDNQAILGRRIVQHLLKKEGILRENKGIGEDKAEIDQQERSKEPDQASKAQFLRIFRF